MVGGLRGPDVVLLAIVGLVLRFVLTVLRGSPRWGVPELPLVQGESHPRRRDDPYIGIVRLLGTQTSSLFCNGLLASHLFEKRVPVLVPRHIRVGGRYPINMLSGP